MVLQAGSIFRQRGRLGGLEGRGWRAARFNHEWPGSVLLLYFEWYRRKYAARGKILNTEHGPMQNTASLRDSLDHKMPAALEMLRQMVGINSYTTNREGVNRLGRFTAQCFAPLGFTAEYVPCTNPEFGDHLVLTRKGSSAKSIALVSHLDTVFPPEEEARNNFHWQGEGERIFGPGTQDIKGGTMMILLV